MKSKRVSSLKLSGLLYFSVSTTEMLIKVPAISEDPLFSDALIQHSSSIFLGISRNVCALL